MKLKEFYAFLMVIENDQMVSEDTEIFIGIDTADGPKYFEPSTAHNYSTGASGGERLTPTLVIYARDEMARKRNMG